MSWTEGLSHEQQQVARHAGSHARLLAGPGTGKTRVMTSRVAYLVQSRHVTSSDILALTFTRAAAAELRSRVTTLLDGQNVPQVSTLHSFALKSLLQLGAGNRLPSPIRIADDYEERWIIERDIKELLGLERISEARDLISQLSADWETLDADEWNWEDSFPNPEFLGVWREHRTIYGYTLRAELVYQLKLALEEGAVHLHRTPKYVMVDEYQDLNACDLSIVKSLADHGAEVYVAGDDDQSIYGFRYADPSGIRRFLVEYQGAADLGLTECRRCGQRILAIAQYVAAQDARRVAKALNPCTESGPGEVHLLRFDDQNEEAAGVAEIARWLVQTKQVQLDRILMLMRADRFHRFSDPVRSALAAVGLDATTVVDPLSVLDDSDGRVFLSLLRLMVNLGDSLAWRDLIKERRNSIGDQTISELYNLARDEGKTFQQALEMISERPSRLPARGRQVKDECERISATVETLKNIYDNAESVNSFVEEAVPRVLNGDAAEGVRALLNNVLNENPADSLQELLVSLTTAGQEAEQSRATGKVNIMTMHQAKGLDADAVFVIAAEDEYIPGRAVGRALEDERRLLYVSLTRARSYLYITHCNKRTGFQMHTGRTSGSSSRTLTQFLSGGPLRSVPGMEYAGRLH